ncbi:MAG: hypothetical protein RQ866_06340 [Bacteroidales bacterium]|nr:hypothetical protein [Bacteroidales bacterium]
MKKIIFTLPAFVLFMLFGFSPDINSEWVTDNTVDGIEFSSKKVHCTFENSEEVHEYVLHTVTNNNSYPVSVEWKKDIWYNDVCRTCNLDAPSGYEFLLTLQAGEKISGSCNDEGYMLKTFSQRINPKSDNKLTRYEFNDIKVNKIE